jgi:hypothetical protein
MGFTPAKVAEWASFTTLAGLTGIAAKCYKSTLCCQPAQSHFAALGGVSG